MKLFCVSSHAGKAQDPRDIWAGHNCDQHHFNKLVAGALDGCGVDFGELYNIVWNCRGIMREPVRAPGREADIRVFHHGTRAMKLRKLLCSATDPSTARDVLRKLANRVRSLSGK